MATGRLRKKLLMFLAKFKSDFTMDALTLNNVSAILITKEEEYPQDVLRNVEAAGFGEIIIINKCEGIYRRYEASPAFPDLYVQDDDCIPDIKQIFSEYNGELITCGMTKHHIKFYTKSRICLIGHGAFFPGKLIDSLEVYRKQFGADTDYFFETDRIFTFLNFPQKRVETKPIQLDSSYGKDRLSMRTDHFMNLFRLEKKLMRFYSFTVSREKRFIGLVRYCYFLISRIFRRTT